MAKKRHILFVSHNASRSGAPMILLELIRAFKEKFDYRVSILIMEYGELVTDFKEIAETYIWYKKPRYLLAGERGFKKWLSRAYYFARGRWILLRLGKPDIVFLNTITNGLIQPVLSRLAKLSVTYVHELEGTASQLNNQTALQNVKNFTDIFWAGSGAVKSFIENKLRVDAQKIHIQYSSLRATNREKNDHARFRKEFLRMNHWAEDSILVGVLAVAESRKGFDLFFPLLSVYNSLYPESSVVFIWKGLNDYSLDVWRSNDFEKAGLHKKVLLLKHGSDNLDFMSCLDIHLLLSREDPYPLVMMEAASFGICTVCFEDSGGAPEFVGEDAGYCLPYGDLVKLAQTIRHLELNPLERKKLGRKAKEKLTRGHQSTEAAEYLNQVIEKKVLP